MNPPHEKTRAEIFAYWEKRRLFYNLALVLPTLLGLGPSLLSIAMGDVPRVSNWQFAGLFVIAACGANVCFTFVYALEFFFAGPRLCSGWSRRGRPMVFAAGTLLAMILALWTAREISLYTFSGPLPAKP